ncbi:MAG: hypothetical protein R6U98_24625 [Pirellulaceae bacterium]
MSTRFSLALLLSFGVAALGILVGCSQRSQEPAAGDGGGAAAEAEDDYNPHDVPITEEQKAELREQTAQFTDAVVKVKEFRNEVERETAAGIPENPYKAHQALDNADLLLQWLPEIARNSGVPKEHWETVNTSANELRTLFEQVHQNIDNKQNPDFAAVADQIDQEIADLEHIPTAPAADAGANG